MFGDYEINTGEIFLIHKLSSFPLRFLFDMIYFLDERRIFFKNQEVNEYLFVMSIFESNFQFS